MTSHPLVLIVDDAALVRSFYRAVLEDAGFRVEDAFNGVEALEKLSALSPDLLIVDVNMPQMDGVTFTRTLRGHALPAASIPILVTSSESAPSDMIAARRAGANCYLVKPITPEALVEYARLLCGVPC